MLANLTHIADPVYRIKQAHAPHVASVGGRVELWAGDRPIAGSPAVEDNGPQTAGAAGQHHVLHIGVV